MSWAFVTGSVIGLFIVAAVLVSVASNAGRFERVVQPLPHGGRGRLRERRGDALAQRLERRPSGDGRRCGAARRGERGAPLRRIQRRPLATEARGGRLGDPLADGVVRTPGCGRSGGCLGPLASGPRSWRRPPR